jgi:glycosyltransferase involved in cell wall biosynthesis
MGSEKGIGWNWVMQICREHDLTLITRHNQVEKIRREAVQEGIEDALKVVGYDPPKRLTGWKRGAANLYPYVYLWNYGAAKVALKLHRTEHFDMAHHITFATSWIPSFLYRLQIPFVWGPVGRHGQVPDWYIREFGSSARAKELLREGLCRSMENWAPGMRKMYEGADVLLLLNEEMTTRIPPRYRDKALVRVAVGTEPIEAPPKERKSNEPLKVVCVGRQIPLKGLTLAIRAFKKLLEHGTEGTLTLIGDGPIRSDLEKLAEELGIKERVIFTGKIPRAEVLTQMSESHVMLFPTFEGGGMVFAEAMEAGLAVIALRRAGAQSIVGEKAGILIDADGYEEAVSGLSTALIRIADDEVLRQELASKAGRRAEDSLRWANLQASIDSIYQRAQEHWQQRT